MAPTRLVVCTLLVSSIFGFVEARGDHATSKVLWQGCWLWFFIMIFMIVGASSSGSGSGTSHGNQKGIGRERERAEDLNSGCEPKDDEPKLGVVHFLDGAFFEEPNYMKTLNGIVRAYWDEKTIFTKGKEREKFWDDVLEEFKKYYEYPDDIKERAGDKAIKTHLKENMKQLLYQEKKTSG